MNYTLKENKKINEKYYYFKHKSGLDVFVIPKDLGTYYSVFGTKYGSIDRTFKKDTDKEFITVPDGIAHFLEHKLFENEDGVDTFSRYAEYGASANAYTSSDKTAYLFSCTENFKESLEILLDFVSHPYFTKQTVDKEQGIISQEIRMYEDNPNWRVYFNLLRALYHNHTVRIDTAGTVESISKITPEILYDCYNTFYNPGNMVLCVSGKTTPEEVEAVCDKVLKECVPVKIERKYEDEPATVCQKNITEKLEVAFPLFSIGIKDNDVPLSGKALMKKQAEHDIILEKIFSKSGDFYNRLYNEGLINNKFSCGYERGISFAFADISGESRDPEKLLSEVEKELSGYIENFDLLFSDEDFETVKRVVYSKNVQEWGSTEDIANIFMDFYFMDGDMLDYPDIVASITKQEVKECFMNTYKKDAIAMSVILPR
ncbi:MAG: insulinase family protein [Clostridia bacterium]|nr:insulinase family protein [Clostridia bacterium]